MYVRYSISIPQTKITYKLMEKKPLKPKDKNFILKILRAFARWLTQ